MAVNNYAPAEYGGYVCGAESGGGGGIPEGTVPVFIIPATYGYITAEDTGLTFGKTWNEIKDAFDAGYYCVIKYVRYDDGGTSIEERAYLPLGNIFIDSGDYTVLAISNDNYSFVTNSADGYPIGIVH